MSTPAAGQVNRCTKDRVRQHYDALFWFYRMFWGVHLHHGLFRTGHESPRQAQVAMLDHCVSLLPEQPKGRVLDIGCGYGATSIYLAKRFGCRVEGISLSGRQIEFARGWAARHGLQNQVRFDRADAESFTPVRESYDLIWVMESSEHFEEKPAFFANAATALRSGGAIMLAAWTAAENANTEWLDATAEVSVCPSFASTGEYEQMLTDTGHSVFVSQDITPLVIPTWNVVHRRIRWLQPFASLFPPAAREFAEAVVMIRNSFLARQLTYRIYVAVRN